MSKVDEILDSIGSMTVLELSELKEAFKERFNVEAAASAAAMPMMMAPGAADGGGDGGGAAEEQNEFDVVLTSAGEKKIQVIKEVRTLTNLGLKDAKELVDSAPKPVLEKASKEDAEKAKELIEAAGGSVELK
jgi:large subunit ribosomal protein L7/L12